MRAFSLYLMPLPLPTWKGGGGTSIYMHIGYVPRERPPFSALNFRSGTHHFHKCQNIPLRSITILHFCRSGDHNFEISMPTAGLLSRARPRAPALSRSSPLELAPEPPPPVFSLCRGAPRSAAGQSTSQTSPTVRSETRIFTLELPELASGAPHFHAQARSGAPILPLCRGTYLPTFGVRTPPPPPGK